MTSIHPIHPSYLRSLEEEALVRRLLQDRAITIDNQDRVDQLSVTVNRVRESSALIEFLARVLIDPALLEALGQRGGGQHDMLVKRLWGAGIAAHRRKLLTGYQSDVLYAATVLHGLRPSDAQIGSIPSNRPFVEPRYYVPLEFARLLKHDPSCALLLGLAMGWLPGAGNEDPWLLDLIDDTLHREGIVPLPDSPWTCIESTGPNAAGHAA
jgi:hypothetical protein